MAPLGVGRRGLTGEESRPLRAVDGLLRQVPRTIEFRFTGHVDPGLFACIEGVQVLESEDGLVKLSLHGRWLPSCAPPRLSTRSTSRRARQTSRNLGYLLGMALYTLVVVVLYPSFKDAANLDQFSGSTAGALFGVTGPLTSPEGWIDGNVYQDFLPLIMLLVTIGYGAASVAGQDEDGTLALVTTLPLRRRRVLLEKVSALVAQAAGLALLTMLCVVALLGLDFGLLALVVGSWTGSRGLALGVASALTAASYLVNALASTITWLRPARYASLFYWSIGNGQLEKGLSLALKRVMPGAN